MTDEELAQSLFGEPEKAVLPGSTTTYSGIAASDSENGHVLVVPNGMTVSGSETAAVKMACTCAVSKGDPVMISHVDGSPIVTGVVGWGDSLRDGLNSTVSSVSYEYAMNYSATTVPTSGWSSTWPDEDGTHYIWRRPIWTRYDGVTATQTPEVARGPNAQDGEDAVNIRISSTRGTVFKNNSVSTTLEAVIFHGGTKIENATQLASEFGVGAYLQWSWRALGADGFSVIVSTDPRISNGGFSLTLSPDDIDVQAVFACDLIY